MNWFDGLEAFIHVGDSQSFSQAARELGCASSVITKRVQWLEQALQTTLFHRTTRQVTLTDSGTYLQQRVRPLLDAWYDIHDELKDYQSKPQGQLKIAFAPTLARYPLFINCIQHFCQQYPELQLEIITVPPATRLSEHQIDILIGIDHYVGDPASTRRAKLFDYSYGVYASHAYLSGLKHAVTIDTLVHQRCLCYRNATTWQLGLQPVAINNCYSFDSGESLLAACLAGMGIMHYPKFMLSDEQLSQLIPLLTDHQSQQETLYLYYSKTEYQARKVSLFIDAMKQACHGKKQVR